MASNINYRGIMDRLMELAAGGNIFEQAEKKKQREYDALDKKWAEEKKMDFLLQRDRQEQESDLAKQGLVNAGQLARQQLMEDTKRAEDINNYNLDVYKTESSGNVDRFNAQTTRGALDLKNRAFDWQATQPEKGILEEQFKAAAAIINDFNATPEARKSATDFVSSRLGGQQPAQTVNPTAQPARKQFVPSTSFDNNKDTAIPQQSKGVQSMTFDTNMGTAGKSPEQFRAETEDLYYRLNPQRKKKRDTWFDF